MRVFLICCVGAISILALSALVIDITTDVWIRRRERRSVP